MIYFSMTVETTFLVIKTLMEKARVKLVTTRITPSFLLKMAEMCGKTENNSEK